MRIKKKNKARFLLKIIFWILSLLFFFILSVFLIRAFSERQIDDVSPLFNCNDGLLRKSDVFAVVPLYQNVSIAGNKTWCNYILSLNKTLIMHGVYHSYREFKGNASREEVVLGMETFKECFGFYPKIFEAPQLAISWQNKAMIKSFGMKLRGYPYNYFHKVYHCNDGGKYSNDFIDRF